MIRIKTYKKQSIRKLKKELKKNGEWYCDKFYTAKDRINGEIEVRKALNIEANYYQYNKQKQKNHIVIKHYNYELLKSFE